MGVYTEEQLNAIYQLGVVYFESGFFTPAERLFNGLLRVDGGTTPALVGIGLIKLERGLFDEASSFFRASLEQGSNIVQARLGLAFAFLASGESTRVRSLLTQIDKDHARELSLDMNLQTLWETAAAQAGLQ